MITPKKNKHREKMRKQLKKMGRDGTCVSRWQLAFLSAETTALE